jgi:putative transposase
MVFKPFHFFALALAGWLNREQQDVIAYLRTENGILRERLGTKRVLLTEQQKCRLAAAAARLGKDVLRGVTDLFSPEALLRWHRWFH